MSVNTPEPPMRDSNRPYPPSMYGVQRDSRAHPLNVHTVHDLGEHGVFTDDDVISLDPRKTSRWSYVLPVAAAMTSTATAICAVVNGIRIAAGEEDVDWTPIVWGGLALAVEVGTALLWSGGRSTVVCCRYSLKQGCDILKESVYEVRKPEGVISNTSLAALPIIGPLVLYCKRSKPQQDLSNPGYLSADF